MSAKPKFQISKSLEERIKQLVNNDDQTEQEFAKPSIAYILGFHHSNVTNFIGLTTNLTDHHAGLQTVGLIFFQSNPTEKDIKARLDSLLADSLSAKSLETTIEDQNKNLFLIYVPDDGANPVKKRIYDTSLGEFPQEQPKLSVLDDSKLYGHSCLVNIKISINLNICDSSKMLNDQDKIRLELERVKRCLSNDTKTVNFNLEKSNFSVLSGTANKNLTETLYDHLDPPDDLDQAGDYVPQLSKADKQKMIEKWRNKMKSQRSSLRFVVDSEELSANGLESTYTVNLESLVYLHLNHSISRSLKSILFSLRHRLDLLNMALAGRTRVPLEQDELKSCTFKPPELGHLVPIIYAIPSGVQPDYQALASLRKEVHTAYLLPLDKPLFRYSQRIISDSLNQKSELNGHLCNVHTSLGDNTGIKGGSRTILKGTYTYYHYMQDRVSDNGWGCAYRSLQTIVSWFQHQGYIYSPDVEQRAEKLGSKTQPLRAKLCRESRVPTHEEIQSVLVDVGDKQDSFIGSQKWIGSQEVCYVLNHLYDINSKFISVSSGGDLVYKARELGQHFAAQSTPIMIGGGVLAHTIIGVDFNEKSGDASYLVLDPHYTGPDDLATITKKGWCGWKKNSFWDKNAFYNLCLPQRPIEY